MALDELLAALDREALAEAESIRTAARAACARIAAESETAVARRQAEGLEQRERELHAAAELQLSAARRAARRDTLVARQALLDRVLAAARERLPAAECEPTALAARVAAALDAVGDGVAEVRCAPALVARVRRLVAARPGTTVLARDAAGSDLVVSAADGAVEVDASLAALLERRWPVLLVELARALEAGS